MRNKGIAAALVTGTCLVALASPAQAQERRFDIPATSLKAALDAYGRQAGQPIIYKPDEVRGARSSGFRGVASPQAALQAVLAKSGFVSRPGSTGAIAVVRMGNVSAAAVAEPQAATEAVGEDIVVTAQKREERLLDVPVPVTALQGAALVNSNQLRLQDYYTKVPGLAFTSGNRGEAFIAVRGITTTPFGNPTVGVMIDDVPFGATLSGGGGLITPDMDPSDLARVEVLKGPQGTLYGVSSLGGLIKFVTVDPDPGRFSGRVSAGVDTIKGSEDIGYSFRGAVNVPLGDTAALRLSGFTRTEPGYVDNVTTGQEDVNEFTSRGGRAALLWRPTDGVRVKLSALLQTRKSDGSSLVFLTPVLGDLEQSYLRGSGWYRTKAQVYSANISADIGGGATLTSLTGYNINRIQDSVDTSAFFRGQALANFGVEGAPIVEDFDTSKISQELRLDAPITDSIDLLVGGFYTREKSRQFSDTVAVNTNSGAQVGMLKHVDIRQRYKEYALFGDVTFRLTDRFDIQLGARQSWNRQDHAQVDTGPTVPGGISIVPRTEIKETPFTYLVTPRFRISDDVMVYARFASGYRAGGVNPTFAQGFDVPPGWDADTTNNYEIGAKGRLFDRLLTFDLSVFQIDWKDIQLQYVSPALVAFRSNGSGARSRGLEFSTEVKPTEGLTLAGNFSWSDAELTEALGAATRLVGNAGDRLPFSSRFTGSFSIDQRFVIGEDAALTFGGTLAHVGARFGLFQATPVRQRYPGYTQLDLRVGLDYGDWNANVFATNVTDKRGLLGGGRGAINANSFTIVQPRTIGLSVGRNF
jgi:outer membrane receptor protein involved in Fe transport